MQHTHEAVILLHGLARSSWSMRPLVRPLCRAGYQVINHDYPSRSESIHALAKNYVLPAIERCRNQGATKIHFVTHSMGGILVRAFLRDHTLPELGKIVMLAPPNRGSEVVDRLGSWWVFRLLHGPAGSQLHTAADSIPNQLGPLKAPVGVITGRRSVNLLLSLCFPGPNDGKVSVERAKVEGMQDFLVLDTTHPTIIWNRNAQQAIIRFLQTGRFKD